MVWKTVKCQGKIREKSGNFKVDDEWQLCNCFTLQKTHHLTGSNVILAMMRRTMKSATTRP